MVSDKTVQEQKQSEQEHDHDASLQRECARAVGNETERRRGGTALARRTRGELSTAADTAAADSGAHLGTRICWRHLGHGLEAEDSAALGSRRV